MGNLVDLTGIKTRASELSIINTDLFNVFKVANETVYILAISSIEIMEATTIVQNEASSAVFGMSAEALRIGAPDYVLSTEIVADFLSYLLAKRNTSKPNKDEK